MIGACVALIAVLSSIAGETKLTAEWATQTARVGDRVDLMVAVTGECAVDAELPPLPAQDAATFEIVDGPTTTTTESGDYRCTWRVVATPRLAGALAVSVRVVCQSSDERVVETAPLAVEDDGTTDTSATFELHASASTVFVGEPFTVQAHIRCAANLFTLADVEADLPWLHDVVILESMTVPDAVIVPVAGESATLRLASRVSGARMQLATDVIVFAPEPGRLTWAGSRLRAKQRDPHTTGAAKFPLEVDVVAGSVDIVALPAAGRPADFVDAVGRYRVMASTDRREAVVGEPFAFTLLVDGLAGGDAGNLAVATLPHAWTLPGFHVALREDERVLEHVPNSRRLVFELRADRMGLVEIPPLAIPSFDPKSRTYVVAWSELIPMRIMEREPSSSAAAENGSAIARPAVIAAIVLAILSAFGFAIATSKRRARGAAPRDPRGAFEHALARCAPDDELANSKALAHAVHAAVGVDAGALFGGGARDALADSRLAPNLVERIASFIEANEDSAFSANRTPVGMQRQRLDEARSLVEALARANPIRAN